MSEGERLAREAARRLLNEIEIDEGASSVDDAMDLCHLEQHVIPEQLELPFSAPKDVRGILDLSGMNVFMRDARPARLRWVGAHEVGHYAIKEHNEILRFCSTFDLSREARIQLEVEANAFAAEFLFQGARFTQECLSEPFSLVLLRSKCVEFGVSYEAGFRRFVEDNPQPIAVLVSNVSRSPDSSGNSWLLASVARATTLRYGSYSPQFKNRFGLARPGQVFAPEHPISQATLHGDATGKISFKDESINVDSFFNGYNVLSILRPNRQ